MTVNTKMVEAFSFAGEEPLGGACSSALRKVKSLADQAPIGRLFASIATLADASLDANRHLMNSDLKAASNTLRSYAQPEETLDFSLMHGSIAS